MTMGASIECRVPFLDYRLVEGLAALPSSDLLAGKGSKPLLRNSIGRQLPKAVQEHRKWGFGVPWKYYLRQVPELRAVVTGLPDMNPFREGPFDRARMRSVVNGFLAGNSQHEELVRQLVMIAIWYQACVDQSSAPKQGVASDYSYV
jgi:asparagine synthase (glutamine-hydrolysing)